MWVKLMPETSSTTTPQLLVNAPTDARRHDVTREAKPSAPRPAAPFVVENVGPAQTDPGSLAM